MTSTPVAEPTHPLPGHDRTASADPNPSTVPERPVKVAIIGGAGGIGSSLAFNLIRTRTPYDITIIDSRPNMVTSHVMDLQDAMALGGATAVRGGSLADAHAADIIVISAAVPLRLNSSRNVYLAENANLLASIVDPLASEGWPGVLVVMTNPVDALITWLQARTGFDRHRVIGYTLNDSLRMRSGVATALGVPRQSIDAWVVGEHGAGQVPLFSRLTVAGEPVTLTDAQRGTAVEYMDTWYAKHVALDSGRTSTWSSGLGSALMVDAIATGNPLPLPVSIVLHGEYGIHGVGLSVPVVLDGSGVTNILQWSISDYEQQGLNDAAGAVHRLVTDIDTARDEADPTQP